MGSVLRRFGLTFLAAMSLTALNLVPAFAQGTYPGSGMPYQAPVQSGPTRYPVVPSYRPPSVGTSLYGATAGALVRYIVLPGDTLTRVAARFGTSEMAILSANPRIVNANRIFVGQALFIPRPVTRSYIVRFGDTLSRIALRFGVSTTAILRANPMIMNPNLIFAGQRLVIPFAGSVMAHGSGSAGAGYGSAAPGYAPAQPGY